MKIDEAAERSARHARKMKEEHVRSVKGKAGRTDILSVLEGFRGEKPAVVTFSPPDRDLALAIAEVMAKGFGADVIAMTMESWGLSVKGTGESSVDDIINPDTGLPFESGDMGRYWEAHGPGGLVTECLFTSVWNRAGDTAVIQQPYLIDGRSVTWLEQSAPETGQLEGYVAEVMAAIMAERTMMQAIGGTLIASTGLAPERITAHGDLASLDRITQITDRDISVLLFAEPGSVRQQVLRERLNKRSIHDPSKWN